MRPKHRMQSASTLTLLMATLPSAADEPRCPPGRRRFTQEELDACTCPRDEMAFNLDCPTHGENGPSE